MMRRVPPRFVTSMSVLAAWLLVVPAISAQIQDGQLGSFGTGLGLGADEPVVAVSGQFTAPTAEEPARLFITARIEPGWHIYSVTQKPGGVIPSEIRLTPSKAYRLLGEFRASPPPKKHAEPLFDNLILEEHSGRVVWQAPIELAAGVDPTSLEIQGSLYAQACKEACIPPRNYPFTATLGDAVAPPGPETAVGPETPLPGQKAASLAEQPAKTNERDAHGLPWVTVKTFAEVNKLVEGRIDLEELEENVRRQEAGEERQGLLWPLTLILVAFAGGIALNVMPCVLPVIGLKVLSFVNQAGENRFRAFMLNVAFSAGLLSVFLILASLAAGLNLQWGAQFQYPWFNVTMAVVVFAMGLSFLGVWEIPIPGFVGSGKAGDLAAREGLSGAFAKGVITTLLATPCTGPGMAFAVTMVMSEPRPLIFGVFLTVGLGMASPYLLIGAFPRLIAFLPKPGEWMETFKQVMGFVLLATAVWILSFIHWPYLVPTVGLMFGVWGACWWIQRKATAEFGRKAMAWIEGLAFAGAVWAIMFPGVYPLSGVYEVMNDRWQFATAGGQGSTVSPGQYTLMIDFTADWCLNCKYVEATVLETEAVRKRIAQNDVVPVRFDMTVSPGDAETKRFIRALRVAQPSLAILPASDPNRPAPILRGVYTQKPVLDGLQQAGPSVDRPRPGGTAGFSLSGSPASDKPTLASAASAGKARR